MPFCLLDRSAAEEWSSRDVVSDFGLIASNGTIFVLLVTLMICGDLVLWGVSRETESLFRSDGVLTICCVLST